MFDSEDALVRIDMSEYMEKVRRVVVDLESAIILGCNKLTHFFTFKSIPCHG